VTERHEDEPVDELGRLANEMLIHLEKLVPEDSTVRCVVFLENDERCMTALNGWESDTEAVSAVFAHLTAVLQTAGIRLDVIPMMRPRGHD
jgi:hypothetical protein